MAISDEDATAQLERLQQQLTRNLQEIDKNFAESNQIISSIIIPEVERYAEATARIWNHCKIWLYFFRSMDENNLEMARYRAGFATTNRPPHIDLTMDSEDNSSWNHQINHDVTIQNITDLRTLSRLRLSLQQPPSTTSQDSASERYRKMSAMRTHTMGSVSTTSSTPSQLHRQFTSPPRTMPFGKPPSSLVGTPIRDAAKILTESIFERAGIRSSDDDSFEFDPDGSNAKKARIESTNNTDDANAGKAWDETNMMEVDDAESRAKFNAFFQQRQNRKLDLNDELPTWRQGTKSPNQLNSRLDVSLANTPTTNRVLEDIMATDQSQAENEGAYEFSDAMPHDAFEEYQTREKQSFSGSDLSLHSESNITMVSGSTGQIPAKFDLHYFPQKFRVPPASSQLTRIYNYFAEQPGAMLTVEDVVSHLSDISTDNIALLINLLVRKKFLKKVGAREAWTVRR